MKKRMILRAGLVLVLCCSMVCNVLAVGAEEMSEEEQALQITLIANEADPTDVTVELEEGESASNSISYTNEYTDTDENGNEVTVTESGTREVTVETGDITTTDNEGHGDVVSVDPTVTPDEYEGKQEVHDDIYVGAEGDRKELQEGYGALNGWTYAAGFMGYIVEETDEDGNTKYVFDPDSLPTTVDGMGDPEYVLVAGRERSYSKVVIKSVSYELDEDGNIKTDENGDPIYDLKTPENSPWKNSQLTAQMVLWGTDGKPYYAYSIAPETEALVGPLDTGYVAEDLEKSDLYDSETKEHIRGIAQHGYWGSAEGETGSLSKLKEEMKTAVENGLELSVAGSSDKEAVLAAIDALTEGDAVTATQAALWAYSLGDANNIDGTQTKVVSGFSSDSNGYVSLIYQYLLGITEEEDELVEIDQDSLSLTIGDRIDEQNAEDAAADGTYEASLNFRLTLIPGENDELQVVLQYTDENGKGQIIMRKLGDGTDGSIACNTDGSYTLTGLVLGENQNYTFDLNLQGTQYLEDGVYVYSATNINEHYGYESDYGPSGVPYSTLVGIGEIGKNVNQTTHFTLNFHVDEEQELVVVPVTPEVPETPEEIETPDNTPEETISEEEVPLDEAPEADETEDLYDGDVPLADVPQTGDNSVLFAILSVLSGGGLAGLALTKKRED